MQAGGQQVDRRKQEAGRTRRKGRRGKDQEGRKVKKRGKGRNIGNGRRVSQGSDK